MIAEDYRDGRDITEMSREYGLQPRRIYQILADAGVKGIKRKKKDITRPLSEVHRKIGVRLYETYFDRGLMRQTAADQLGTTPPLLRRIEKGRHNLNLFELQDIASFIGTSVGDLIDGS